MLTDVGLDRQLADRYGLHGVTLERLEVLVNDVYAVTAEEGRFALKLYHRARTPAAVGWELDLVDHLFRGGAPVVRPVPGRTGLLQRFPVEGEERVGALFGWAAGSLLQMRFVHSMRFPHSPATRFAPGV